jgi:hypothetical protein
MMAIRTVSAIKIDLTNKISVAVKRTVRVARTIGTKSLNVKLLSSPVSNNDSGEVKMYWN